MDVKAYLERIGYRGSLDATAGTLRDLQVAHLRSVPFENLSIHAGEPIVLGDVPLFEKIVSRRRGGFCYELNGLFARLLGELGFKVEKLAAGVARPTGEFGPAFDHMTLVVTLEERWLVDVGFGDSFSEPLLLDKIGPQDQGERSYRIDRQGAYLVLTQSDRGGEWKAQYRFTLTPYQYDDYKEMCLYHQTSVESHFTRQRICSMATPDGRVTLSGMRLITTGRDARLERELKDNDEYASVLYKEFGIKMDQTG